ncbi:MAG: hypothetical protein ACWIPH_04050 [Ostreibacterium sp.]
MPTSMIRGDEMSHPILIQNGLYFKTFMAMQEVKSNETALV